MSRTLTLLAILAVAAWFLIRALTAGIDPPSCADLRGPENCPAEGR